MSNDVQQALLIKNAYKHPHETNTTALVTANGHVTIAHVDDLNTLFQFTLEQWQEIVEFVELATWQPEWDDVPDKFNYVAMDKRGDIYQYTTEPTLSISEEMWVPNDAHYKWGKNEELKAPTGLDWKKSLRKRPTSK